MKFLLLIEDGGVFRNASEAERRSAHETMDRFTDSLKARGALKACDALHPDTEGARVQVRDGQALVMNGPFAETKEVVGGFYLVECADKAQAIAFAKECPAATWGTVEVREIR